MILPHTPRPDLHPKTWKDVAAFIGGSLLVLLVLGLGAWALFQPDPLSCQRDCAPAHTTDAGSRR